MEKVAKSGKALLVVFVEEGGKPLNHQLEEAVKRVCERFDIGIVKVDEQEGANKYGIDEFPTMVYFEDGIPTIFEDENDEGKGINFRDIHIYLAINSDIIPILHK